MKSSYIEKLENYLNSTNEKGRCVLFFICCCFTFGGAVNLGMFGFFPALPFIAGLFYLSHLGGKFYKVVGGVVFIICLTLYAFKYQHGPLFYPVLDKDMVVARNLCISRSGTSAYIKRSRRTKCGAIRADGSLASKELIRGSILKVKEIYVSHSDSGEKYIIKFDTALGEAKVFQFNEKNPELVWRDGSPVATSDLRRNIFYYPSLLMFWPTFPVVIVSQILALF